MGNLKETKGHYLKLLRIQSENKKLNYAPSIPQKKFHESLARFKFIRAGSQSGKTYATTHELAWWITERHPYRKLPEFTYKIAWVVGTSKGDVTANIWELYLKSFIPKRYIKKESRVGGVLDHVEFTTGWKLYFKSYEAGRESMQGTPVDLILVDEMLPDVILDELEARVATTQGSIVYSFTPLKVSHKVRKYFEDSASHVETFLMNRYDNPAINKDQLDAEIANWDKGKISVRIYGEWVNYEGRLFPAFSKENVIKPFNIPEKWRKICSIDPATSADTGVIWATENPYNGSWYIYRDLLVNKLAPSDLIHEIIKETHGETMYLYFVDQQAAYLVAEARKFGIALCGVKKKNEKENMVNEVNQAFKDKSVYIFNTCRDTIRQVSEYANVPNVNEFKPIKENDHTVDALCYFYRGKPQPIVFKKKKELGQRILDSFMVKDNNTKDFGVI